MNPESFSVLNKTSLGNLDRFFVKPFLVDYLSLFVFGWIWVFTVALFSFDRAIFALNNNLNAFSLGLLSSRLNGILFLIKLSRSSITFFMLLLPSTIWMWRNQNIWFFLCHFILLL